jgi:hypothetical protein
MGKLEQEARAGFPARKRWEACFVATFFFVVVCFAGRLEANAFQAITPATAAPQHDASPVTNQPTKPGPTAPASSATQKPKPQPPQKPSLRVNVVTGVPIPSISVHAKNVQLSAVTAVIERELKIPIVLSTKMKQQELTTDFENFPVESAVKLLAPRAIIDYVISGGNGELPSTKEPKAIYLMAYDEKPPREGPWTANKSGAEMLVGVVYATEEEEKAALEIKERDLQVTFKDNLFTVKAHKQYLTDVLHEIAAKAEIAFVILTTDGSQKEIDQVVSWSIDNSTLEELTRTWFPNAIRLYWRTDLESFVSKPLRITIEQNSGVQAEQPAVQNVTP